MSAEQGRARLQPAARSRTLAAGLLLSIAGVAKVMGSITAEALHPGPYTTHADTFSHLGASEPPDSVVVQPSAAIFDGTMLSTGALILAAWCAHRALHRKALTVPRPGDTQEAPSARVSRSFVAPPARGCASIASATSATERTRW